jgi:V/A-type H+-transporting ATPase subunit I
MAKVLIVGPKDLQTKVIKTVQGLGKLHLAAIPKDASTAILNPDEQARRQQLEQWNSEIDQLLVLFGFRGKASKPQLPDWDGLQQFISGHSDQVKTLARQRMELEDELSLVLSYRSAYEAISPLMERLEASRKLKAFGFILKGSDPKAVTALSLLLRKAVGGRCEVYSHPLPDGRTAALAAYHASDTEAVRSFFAKIQISELKLPAAMESLPMPQVVAQLKQKASQLPKQIAEIKQQLSTLSAEVGPQALWYKRSIEDELERFKAAHQTVHSQLTFILQGYLPQSELEPLKDRIKDQFGGKVTVQIIDINHHDAPNVPVVLKNNPIVRPFELMLSIFNPPQYGTVDPTPFIAFFFPMYFGFIVGDIGYGLAMLLIVMGIRFKYKANELVKSLTTMFIICSLWSTAFGVLYGELFGDLGEHFHIVKPILEKVNRLSPESRDFLRNIAWYTGGFQILVGYAILFYQGWKHKDWHHMLEAPAFVLGIISFLGIFFTKFLPILPKNLLIPSLVGSVISAIMLIKVAGIGAFFEIFGAIGNILSFARLFAIGLSAAYLGYAANMIARLMSGSILMTILGVLIGIVFHVLFFGLGLISPIMQPFRLQVVEFFTKFKYHDYSGKKYKPLKTLGGD